MVSSSTPQPAHASTQTRSNVAASSWPRDVATSRAVSAMAFGRPASAPMRMSERMASQSPCQAAWWRMVWPSGLSDCACSSACMSADAIAACGPSAMPFSTCSDDSKSPWQAAS